MAEKNQKLLGQSSSSSSSNGLGRPEHDVKLLPRIRPEAFTRHGGQVNMPLSGEASLGQAGRKTWAPTREPSVRLCAQVRLVMASSHARDALRRRVRLATTQQWPE